MNNTRRKAVQNCINVLAKEIEELNRIHSNIEDIGSEESDAYDNLPEGIQCSDRGCAMEENITKLEDAADTLSEAIDIIQNALDALCEVD